MRISNLTTIAGALSVASAQLYSFKGFQSFAKSIIQIDYFRDMVVLSPRNLETSSNAMEKLQDAVDRANAGDTFYWYNKFLGRFEDDVCSGLDGMVELSAYVSCAVHLSHLVLTYGPKYAYNLYDTFESDLIECLDDFIYGDESFTPHFYMPGKTELSFTNHSTNLTADVFTPFYAVSGFDNQTFNSTIDRAKSYYHDLMIKNPSRDEATALAISNLRDAHARRNHGDVFYWYNIVRGLEYDGFGRQPSSSTFDCIIELSHLSWSYGLSYLYKLHGSTELKFIICLNMYFKVVPQAIEMYIRKIEVNFENEAAKVLEQARQQNFRKICDMSHQDYNLIELEYRPKKAFYYYDDLVIKIPHNPELTIESMLKLQDAYDRGNEGDIFYWYNAFHWQELPFEHLGLRDGDQDRCFHELNKLARAYGANYPRDLYYTSEKTLVECLDLYFNGNQIIKDHAYALGKTKLDFLMGQELYPDVEYEVNGFQNKILHDEFQYVSESNQNYYKDIFDFLEDTYYAFLQLQDAHFSGNHGDLFYWYNTFMNQYPPFVNLSLGERDRDECFDELNKLARVYGANYLLKLYDTSERSLVNCVDLFFHGDNHTVTPVLLSGKKEAYEGSNITKVPKQTNKYFLVPFHHY
ncbi:uncharacterized protein CANTADRAFT_87908 [Suhomyces tanzawaensis NRRL Y-17324]|uniref:Uncharacterized protein n=1 Tax=Suhomyces tanzawaensis NRRL Y-17324 TaxID=984487 RepID=A0A1E4SRD5_9ASCO|nr:uncharacterized protein CANTADRAFT_87908 [Suhomyces tanzawaensis NRRL Y-17324]ODV81962.1 hypothetical protein CANTADRAFT_87908 [Suhomyces tanzawaensis NRRL Y-17324]